MDMIHICRAKRLDNGEWVEGYYHRLGNDNGEYEHYILDTEATKHQLNLRICFHKVDPSTVCRCTGLQDKNGKFIFTNDLVKLVLDSGEERIFKVVIKPVERVLEHPEYFTYSKVLITGVVFEWQGMELIPNIDDEGIPDNLKMEIIGNTIDTEGGA